MNSTMIPTEQHVHLDLDLDMLHKFHYRSRGRTDIELCSTAAIPSPSLAVMSFLFGLSDRRLSRNQCPASAKSSSRLA